MAASIPVRSAPFCGAKASIRLRWRNGVSIKRGPPAHIAPAKSTGDDEARALRRENAKLRRELEAARLAIDIQKKVAALMESKLTGSDDGS